MQHTYQSLATTSATSPSRSPLRRTGFRGSDLVDEPLSRGSGGSRRGPGSGGVDEERPRPLRPPRARDHSCASSTRYSTFRPQDPYRGPVEERRMEGDPRRSEGWRDSRSERPVSGPTTSGSGGQTSRNGRTDSDTTDDPRVRDLGGSDDHELRVEENGPLEPVH